MIKINIQHGDIVKLGDHVLGCGSATDTELVAKVLTGGGVKVILTDPPYGVDYVASKKDFAKLRETRRVLRQYLEEFKDYLRPKPRWCPWWFWNWMQERVLRMDKIDRAR